MKFVANNLMFSRVRVVQRLSRIRSALSGALLKNVQLNTYNPTSLSCSIPSSQIRARYLPLQ